MPTFRNQTKFIMKIASCLVSPRNNLFTRRYIQIFSHEAQPDPVPHQDCCNGVPDTTQNLAFGVPESALAKQNSPPGHMNYTALNKIAWYLIAGWQVLPWYIAHGIKLQGQYQQVINSIDSFQRELAKDLEQKASRGTQSAFRISIISVHTGRYWLQTPEWII